ncbi:signal peptidase I [Candidatus Amesbacteria bacterium RIFOXYB1_FULL_44_23]|uniref:Signal peptidase I n=1 Tax=Candidatus Amesbacteria bacterium RIFOXYB1_FULL_44_23 TaxID=1797263 RepID=A0A1F4ZWV6_9BACT|nr:MAG: signal peptidase I [Candidatus Amesbacteria bacterium RIFOXYB1_FULL_44_23]
MTRIILSILGLPILLFIDVFRSPRSVVKKILWSLLILILFGFTWISGYQDLFTITKYTLYDFGLVDKLTEVPVRGTSMLPTIQDGQNIKLNSPKKYLPAWGDIVSFSNNETEEMYYLKRIIGQPGDKVSFINGQVRLNGQFLKEDYIYQGNPTYGNTYLIDCREYQIPENKFLVMGDNRIASTDSRVIGFVDRTDIEGVIKTNLTVQFNSSVSNSIFPAEVVDSDAFLKAINQSRIAQNISPLILNSQLSQLAKTRAEKIAGDLASDHINTPDLRQTLEQGNYDFIQVQEVITMGNYNADQLSQHVLELYPYAADFLSSEYYEIGLGVVPGVQDQCHVQVINIILAWPQKPNYNQKILDNWNHEIDQLTLLVGLFRDIKKESSQIPVSEIQLVIDDLSDLLDKASQLRVPVTENRWLTSTESLLDAAYWDDRNKVVQKVGDFTLKYLDQIPNSDLRDSLSIYKWGNLEFNKESDKAKLLFGQEKYQEQLDSAQKLLTLSKTDEEKAIAYYWQGLAYYSLKQMDKASQSLNQSVKLNPDYAAAYSTLSAVSLNTQQYSQSIALAKKCIALDPEYAWCYNNLGIATALSGNKTEGLKYLQKAISLDPDSYTFNENYKRVKNL